MLDKLLQKSQQLHSGPNCQFSPLSLSHSPSLTLSHNLSPFGLFRCAHAEIRNVHMPVGRVGREQKVNNESEMRKKKKAKKEAAAAARLAATQQVAKYNAVDV